MDTIYWFSGTGNSLYAAKRLAAGLGNPPLVRMTDNPQPVGGKGDKVGFVFPSYFGNLPRAVRLFVEKLEIQPDTYIFAIVTGGGAKTGSLVELRALLKKKGLVLSYGRGLFMTGNYIVNYNPGSPEAAEKTLDRADKHIQRFAADISGGAVSVIAIPITANYLYKNIEKLDAIFTVSEACTSCGLCEKLCPVSNIRMTSDQEQPGKEKPEWQHRCEQCMACISWCPVKAIDYGGRTQARRRYQNPRIKAEELFREVTGAPADK